MQLPSPHTLSLSAAIFCALSGLAVAAPERTEPANETDDIQANIARNQETEVADAFDILDEFSKTRRKWSEAIGLEYAVTYYAYGAGIMLGDKSPSAGSGELALQGIWAPGKRWSENPVELHFRVRDRQAFGDKSPSALGREIGALWGVADGFTDAGFQFPDFYFQHKFTRSGIELRYGQLSIDSQFDTYSLRGAKQSFLNQAFASNPTVAFPGYGAGLTIAKKFDNGIGLVVGATNVQSTTAGRQVDLQFGSSDFFESAQVGYDFKAWGTRASSIKLMFWHSDSVLTENLSEGKGISLTGEQEIDWADLRVFARIAMSNGGSTVVDRFASCGVGWKIREDGMLGAAIGMGRGSTPGRPVQSVFETFYRWHPRKGIRITPEIQVLAGEGYIGTPGVRLLFGLRAGIDF